MNAFRWYQTKLSQRPLLTQVVTTAVLFGTGDLLAQQVVEKTGWQKHSWARTGRMVLYGGAVFGPGATLWIRMLQRRVKIPNKPNVEILTKVGLDQTVFASTNMFLFLSSMALMEGTDPQEKLKSTYFTALSRNWMVWPPVQFINFKYVPLDWRVMVVNVVSIFWNCYLSYVNSGGGKPKLEGEPPSG